MGASKKEGRSCTKSILVWGIGLPMITIALAVALPLAYRSALLSPGQPFSLIANQTVIDSPSSFHSRWRGPDYIDQYDRFFFQWWNFLVYDADTHDHWTIVYHTTKFSSSATYDDYASTSLVHKRGPIDILTAHDSIPLADLDHTRDWDIALRKPDGSVPHRVTIIDDDTYNVAGDVAAADVSTNLPMRWNLTFHRVHGVYAGLDNEEGNKEHCAIVSTLFGYHSKVSGWIEEGGLRREFGTDGAAGKRYRAYAAGSWGCKLPAGFPEMQYPWTWIWIVIPGDEAASPPRPEIGMSMGTARFQLNNTLLGDLYGGFATIGVGDDIVTSNFGTLHHNQPWSVPLTKSSTDSFLKVYDLSYGNWTDLHDATGAFTVPLIQRYDVETAHYRFQVEFHSRPEQYFRLPVVIEQKSTDETETRQLAVFSDFRACGVRTNVRVWYRDTAPTKQSESDSASASVGTSTTTSDGGFALGGWDRVVYAGEITSLNAIEFAYQAPVDERAYEQFIQPQKFAREKKQAAAAAAAATTPGRHT